MLSQLRIKARSVMVPWDHVICHVTPSSTRNPSSTNLSEFVGYGVTTDNNTSAIMNGSIQLDDRPVDFTTLPETYVVSMNETIKRHIVGNTALVFLNLPVPPGDDNRYSKYLDYCDVLSSGLPPTLLVHGISSVISTGL